MVKIRLMRLGRKKRPFFRMVVTDIRNRRNGAPIAELGYYDPIRKQLKINKSLAQEWLSKGAQPTETAKRLIDMAAEDGSLVELPKKQAKGITAPAPVQAAIAEPSAAAVSDEPTDVEEAAGESADAKQEPAVVVAEATA